MALGISADVAVVVYTITERSGLSFFLASIAAAVFLVAWYLYPMTKRKCEMQPAAR
jgi:hypothetical protein